MKLLFKADKKGEKMSIGSVTFITHSNMKIDEATEFAKMRLWYGPYRGLKINEVFVNDLLVFKDIEVP